MMKTRELILLLLIVAAGVFLYHYETGEIENWALHWIWDGDGPFFRIGKAFTFEEAGELPPPFSRSLEVVNERGSVDIRGGPGDGLAVTLSKKIWRRTEEDARRTADGLGLLITDDGGKVIVAAGRPATGRRIYETHFTLRVPEGMNVTVRNARGRVKTFRTAETVITNSHGAVKAGDVAGTLTVKNRHGDVEAADVASEASIRNRHAAVGAVRVKGNLLVEHSHGPIAMEDIGGDITVLSSHSRVTGRRLAGTVRVDGSYNPVTLTDTGPAFVKARHSVITLRDVRGDIDIANSYGRTEISDSAGRVKIQGRNMAVRAEGLTSSEIDITTSHRGVDLRNFSGPTTIRQKHAAVRLEPASLDGDLRVEAAYSPVELLWPASARAPVECGTRNGRIHWRLPSPPSLETSNGHSLLKAFLEEAGKPLVILKTSYADITISEAAPAARRER